MKDLFIYLKFLKIKEKSMKRVIAAVLGIFLAFGLCFCGSKEYRKVKVGIIDSCISEENQERMQFVQINDIVQIKTESDITHGSIITQIILQTNPNCEIFYCSIYGEKCVGKIDDVITAINWCIDNNVEVITMSFATLNDDPGIKECIQKALDKGIIITASCMNFSDKTCYPAMYDGVISVSEGFNPQATVVLRGKQVKVKIGNTKLEKREVSFLTAYVCGIITKQLANGEQKEEIIENLKIQ